jgi:hypothetical protein
VKGVNFLRPLFVDTFPPVMDSGVLYVSIPYSTCGHLCACGCGEEVVTPLSPAQWALTFDGEAVSLMPSIGNWGLPCRSHYWICRGTVRWSRHYTAREIDDNRKRDRQVLRQHLGESPHGRLDRLYRWVRGQGS